MGSSKKNDLKDSLIVPVGWLFADLLLALAMLFLVANTMSPHKVAIKPTPTIRLDPTPLVTPSPSPTANVLILEPSKVSIRISGLDTNGLLVSDPGAINDLEGKITAWMRQHGYQNRRAGIAIVYGGANSLSANAADRATSIAGEVYRVLDMLGQRGFVFCHTVHFDALFTTNIGDGSIEIDTYFFSASAGGC